MKLSIVIPAWNEARLLPGTLVAVEAAARAVFPAAGIEWEVIVCDNNSTDNTAALARAAGALVIHEPINQIGRARNTGATAAGGDWILFLDADSTPSVAMFAELSGHLRDSRVLYGGAPLEMDTPIPGSGAVVALWHGVARLFSWAAGSFLFVRRAAFVSVGGFSPELFAGEELDLSARLRALARHTGRRFVMLESPLITSGRKLHSWGPAYHAKLFWRVISSRGESLKNRKECAIWYEGR